MSEDMYMPDEIWCFYGFANIGDGQWDRVINHSTDTKYHHDRIVQALRDENKRLRAICLEVIADAEAYTKYGGIKPSFEARKQALGENK